MKFRVKDASSTHFMLRAGSTKNLPAGLRSGLEGRVGFDYKMFTKLKNISLCILPLAAQNLWTTATDAKSSGQASKAF